VGSLPLFVSSDTRDAKALFWILTGSNVSEISANDPSLARYHFDTERAFVLGNEDRIQNLVISGYLSTPTLKYESYTRFRSDVENGRIDPSITAVMYDPELWPLTPHAEKRDPKRYLRQFATLAHAHGYKVITGPSRDLMNAPFAYCRKRSQETLSRAYIRCRIAAEAARYADAFTVQAQVHENDPRAYRWFVNAAAKQARAANAGIVLLSNLATSPFGFVATPGMLMRAHSAVDDIVAGHTLTINAGEYEIAEEFLRRLRAADE
jgi:hypothetical protein